MLLASGRLNEIQFGELLLPLSTLGQIVSYIYMILSVLFLTNFV